MLISASSDFIALCREQMALLTQGLGASLSVVYLTQELVKTSSGEAQLIPVVVYPETVALRHEEQPIEATGSLTLPDHQGRWLTAVAVSSDSTPENSSTDAEDYRLNGNQLVLPLIYEGVMMGLLVTGREDRAWSDREQGEIQRIAQTLAIACIIDQRRAWLEQQLQQQQILQEEQRDLFDNLLHQFRNPLTAMRTFGKLLLKRLKLPDPNREVASSIVRESDRLQELLQKFDEVIDLTQADLVPLSLPAEEIIEQNNSKPQLLLPGTGEQVSDYLLADILNPLLLSAQAIAQERNLQLITRIPANLSLVKVNIKALTEALSNIIDNALKYTPAGGKILVQAGQEKANFQGVSISDTGPGIPEEDLQHLGERHYRGVQAQTEIPGTGLGIAIAIQLIEQMQGKIEVFSPAIKSEISDKNSPGTTFIIWLPKALNE
ncbi:MAG TPA: ATP-binding protein [Nostocaceae cyanobacterium]|nr:ATP-binding protein [Nostocaceae cyanobacterium]